MRRIVTPSTLLLFPTLLLTLACEQKDGAFAEADSKIDSGAEPVPGLGLVPSFPTLTCIDSLARTATLREVGAVAASRGGTRRPTQDRDWIPSRIVDLQATPAGIAVLDGEEPQLYLFSNDFESRRRIGRKGAGPGEYEHPKAIELSPDRKAIWVLDSEHSRIISFSLDGRYQRMVQIDRPGLDFAIDSNGTFYVANLAIPSSLRARGADSLRTIVSAYSADGKTRRALVIMRPEDYGSERLPLPGPNELRLVSLGGTRIAVVYTSSGVVEVYENGRFRRSFHACMPQSVREAYQEQRRAFEAGRTSQRSFRLISDVQLEDQGVLHVIGFRPDSNQLYHIDSWRLSGEPLGSTAFSARQIRLPRILRFGDSLLQLLAAQEAGYVARLALTFGPPRSGGRAP